MRNEENCPRNERKLLAIWRYSNSDIPILKQRIIDACCKKKKKEYYSAFIGWEPQKNEIIVFISYAYADLLLYKDFNCVFKYNAPENYALCDLKLTQSLFEGWFPCDGIDHGHKHIIVLTASDSIPGMLLTLPQMSVPETNWNWNPDEVVGICNVDDIEDIIYSYKKNTKP